MMPKSTFASLLVFVSLVTAADLPLVDSETLRSKITLDGLLKHAQKLQDIADATPHHNRLFGSIGHNNTVQYVYDTLNSLGDHYDVYLQGFPSFSYTPGSSSLNVDGNTVSTFPFDYSPNGNVTEVLVPVANQGCEAGDYPTQLSGKVALISRGACDFGLKSALAGGAGALGAIIYNNVDGEIGSGTLGVPPRPEGDYVPIVGITKAKGLEWSNAIAEGEEIIANVVVDGAITEPVVTNNVVAETKQGNHDDVLFLGAHSDSVAAGPGINDNGSGSAALLELAIQLVDFKVNNAVRFAWWSAEEAGLLGSEYWVKTASPEELAKVRIYLNFDMIASPNYILGVYDGDGSTFNVTGPPGSAEAEKLFHDYYASVGLNSTDVPFSGRSDYGPFLDVGIASAGGDTGAEGIKTEEEAALFGGEAGVAYDVNYHRKGDTIDNLSKEAFEINGKAIAHALAVYGASFESLPPKAQIQTDSYAKEQKPLRIFRGDLVFA